ncbi:type III restriction-modification system endonuclease [Shewanella xiamenensis]|uniref:type III restriction-modification system endonuclease n=1 Tax=Shewanella xiamenensis TaxID=332186 RepID=UPI0021C1AF4F|nr:DEAD/DEAH box helicase family protein [Shewanella xiamenensis]MCT8876486.1 DEAD/DEAH box helicase family protein [Shewanella xiamenensis]
MKLKFKHQAYQANSVQAVVDCFKGQRSDDAARRYRIDPGSDPKGQIGSTVVVDEGFKNADLQLSGEQLLANIQAVQARQYLPQSTKLVVSKASPLNLDIEMETGTGKTYCYVKTIFELNKQFGWSKFIIVVPSIAIREGVYKSLQITAEHFLEDYHKKARFFIYNSKQLHELETFSSDGGINVMVINVQAFNARGADARRIYGQERTLADGTKVLEGLDSFRSRKPIDIIKANRPIMILDEPQKMEGAKTLDSFAEFNPLFMLRYSATHKTEHNKIFRLDALDAYNQKLVKKIAVRGITTKGLAGTNAYLYLEQIEVSAKKAPVARLEFEVRLASGGIKREIRKVNKGYNLFEQSNGLDQYQGFVVSDINANTDTISFTNGVELTAGDACGDVSESALRRMQIREAVKAHFEKERQLFGQGIKVLSLFFIDEVAKYRDYSAADEKGEYARMFEEEYLQERDNHLGLFDGEYQAYLKEIPVDKTHNGYFSIDKKSKRLVDPAVGKKSTETDDVDAYDLILKDKEKLLSFAEPTRFIFSHSALREGWDNPNVFVICTLKHSDNTISRRQEVGRGLRLAVNQFGDRMDDPLRVHDINRLTVVASESYKDFVAALQRDISDSLSARPQKADAKYFTGLVLHTEQGDIKISEEMARKIERYLVKNDYTDEQDRITDTYLKAKEAGSLAPWPEDLQPYASQLVDILDAVYSDKRLPDVGDDRKGKINPLNSNFDKKEFQELWSRINHKAIYQVEFDSNELVNKASRALDAKLRVEKLHFNIVRGEQVDGATAEQLKAGQGFMVSETEREEYQHSVHSSVKYDLLGKISELTKLKRSTVAAILQQIEPSVFAQFKHNPEDFISKAAVLINEQKATMVVEHLTYDLLEERFDTSIFTAGQVKQDFTNAGNPLKKHIYDYLVTDSEVERKFVFGDTKSDEQGGLELAKEVSVYAKLPKGFFIPTPVGNYNPDWAIAFEEGAVKHVYFVAETKGSMASLQLKGMEEAKIECAQRFFNKLNAEIVSKNVTYNVVNNFKSLMDLVR